MNAIQWGWMGPALTLVVSFLFVKAIQLRWPKQVRMHAHHSPSPSLSPSPSPPPPPSPHHHHHHHILAFTLSPSPHRGPHPRPHPHPHPQVDKLTGAIGLGISSKTSTARKGVAQMAKRLSVINQLPTGGQRQRPLDIPRGISHPHGKPKRAAVV